MKHCIDQSVRTSCIFFQFGPIGASSSLARCTQCSLKILEAFQRKNLYLSLQVLFPLCRSTLLFLNVSQVGATEAFTGRDLRGHKHLFVIFLACDPLKWTGLDVHLLYDHLPRVIVLMWMWIQPMKDFYFLNLFEGGLKTSKCPVFYKEIAKIGELLQKQT